MILKVHLDGAASYDVGDEIWQESLADAIHAEAETIAIPVAEAAAPIRASARLGTDAQRQSDATS